LPKISIRLESERVTFFRQAALLLPSAFLLGVLLFLLTHGRQDPGFGAYPFFEPWVGQGASAEARFVEQACLFFLPAYAVTLLFLLCVGLAERAVFGPRQRPPRTQYRRAFGPAYAILFLIATGVALFAGDRIAERVAPGALVAPILAAVAPFAGAVLALLPAAVVAAPLAALRRADPT